MPTGLVLQFSSQPQELHEVDIAWIGWSTNWGANAIRLRESLGRHASKGGAGHERGASPKVRHKKGGYRSRRSRADYDEDPITVGCSSQMPLPARGRIGPSSLG